MKSELRDRILVMDGAMGTLIQSSAKDSLNITSPEIVTAIHQQYLEAGADLIKTNTFNSNSGPEDYALNVAGARLARAAADEFTSAYSLKPRYVAGAMGPGRDGAASTAAYFDQAMGLVEGGVDILLAETITSVRTAQSALTAFERVFEKVERRLPVMLSITISRNGGLLSGEPIEAFCSAVSGSRLFSVGINCGFGARGIRSSIERLSGMATTQVSCHPSAGLPNSSGGYDETPEEIAGILGELSREGLIDIIGGCCGTTPAHIRAIADAVRGIPHATIDPL